MAGFSAYLSTEPIDPTRDQTFERFTQSTAQLKAVELPAATARGRCCIAAKLDSTATLHPGIVRDERSGSWLLAAGTVAALEGDNHPTHAMRRLLDSYLAVGCRALDGYDGHFGLVIYDGRDESLSVISDAMGLFSIFYGQQGGEVFISTSAIAIAKQIHAQPDLLAIEHFLRSGRLDGEKTLWLGVKRMLAAQVLKVKDGRVDTQIYWMPTVDPAVSRLTLQEALSEYDETLSKAFTRLLDREGRTWLDLTGGLDSRLAGTYVAKLNLPFTAYCMGPSDNPDVRLARKISETLHWDFAQSQLPDAWGTDQYDLFATALNSGDGAVNALRSAVVRRGFEARSTVASTNVTGIGGENLRGYYWTIEKGNLGKTSRVSYEALLDHLIPNTMPPDVMRFDRSGEVRQELLAFVKQLCAPYQKQPNYVQLDRVEMYRDAGHGGAYLSLTTGIQRELAPFCFKAPASLAISLNYRWKLPRFSLFPRALMERENRALASLATTAGGPAFPIRITNLHQFWPMWKGLSNRAVEIASKKVLRRTLRIWPQARYSSYPLPSWRNAFHQYAQSEGMLSAGSMVSGGLYEREALDAYIARSVSGGGPTSEFLDHVVSIEMAMRASNCCID